MNDTIELLGAHRSIRVFKEEPVEDDLVAAIVVAGMSASTSSNMQAATVIRVRNTESPQKKPRLPLSLTLKDEVYDGDRDEQHIAEYDRVMAAYYADRELRNRTWTSDMAGLLLGRKSRPHLREFLASRGLTLE